MTGSKFKKFMATYAFAEGDPDKLKKTANNDEKNGGFILDTSDSLGSYTSLYDSTVARCLNASEPIKSARPW
jgi:hypothetical protein